MGERITLIDCEVVNKVYIRHRFIITRFTIYTIYRIYDYIKTGSHRSVLIRKKLCRIFCWHLREISPLAKSGPSKSSDGNEKYNGNDGDYHINFHPCAPRKLTVRAVLDRPENEMLSFVGISCFA